jgi:hypothetical protein
MKISTRLLLFGAGAALMLGTLTACGGGAEQPSAPTTTQAAPTTTAAAMPESATFTAEMPVEGHPMMSLAVEVAGDNVVAYACNGTDDAAYFWGTQKNGVMELTSPYQDKITATFDGTDLTGSLTMNEPDAKPMNFRAARATGPAGIYTATMGDARASWVVMSDDRMYGVMQPNSRRDRELIDKINAQQQQFKDQVRQARVELQMQQAPSMSMGSMTTDMDGKTARVVRVTPDMMSLPTTN